MIQIKEMFDLNHEITFFPRILVWETWLESQKILTWITIIFHNLDSGAQSVTWFKPPLDSNHEVHWLKSEFFLIEIIKEFFIWNSNKETWLNLWFCVTWVTWLKSWLMSLSFTTHVILYSLWVWCKSSVTFTLFYCSISSTYKNKKLPSLKIYFHNLWKDV